MVIDIKLNNPQLMNITDLFYCIKHSPDYWDRYCYFNGRLFVKGFAIINQYISINDAIMIEYSFN